VRFLEILRRDNPEQQKIFGKVECRLSESYSGWKLKGNPVDVSKGQLLF